MKPLGLRQIAGYGSGDFAVNIYWGGTSFFLLYWYTDVAMLPNALAGFLFMVGSIWDAVTDPLMGVLAERTRSRWGRYRPYLLLGSVPLAASFVLLLWVPPLTGMALTGALIAAHLLFRTAFTVVSVPYSALSARLTQNSQDRTRLSGARMLGATMGSITIAASAFPLATWLGNGNERDGFLLLAVLAGVLAVAVQVLCFMNVREPDESDAITQAPSPTIAEAIRTLRHNRPFQLVFLAVLLSSSAGVFVSKNVLYFVKYGLEQHDKQFVVVLMMGLVSLVMVPIWAQVALRLGKRNTWLLLTAITCCGQLALLLGQPDTLTAFITHLMMIVFASSGFGVLFWSMLPDTVEYGQWQSGVRTEAMVFGFTTFAQKLSIGLAGWGLGFLLNLVGFQAGETQGPDTIQGLLVLMTLLPMTIALITGAIIWRYPIDATLHARMVTEIGSKEQHP